MPGAQGCPLAMHRDTATVYMQIIYIAKFFTPSGNFLYQLVILVASGHLTNINTPSSIASV